MGDFFGLCVLPDATLMGDAQLIELNKTYTKNIELDRVKQLTVTLKIIYLNNIM